MCLVLSRTRTFPQKQGGDVQLRVYGDEFYARYETMDGYTVVYDTDKETYCYAALAKGYLISSGAPLYKPVPMKPSAISRKTKTYETKNLTINIR